MTREIRQSAELMVIIVNDIHLRNTKFRLVESMYRPHVKLPDTVKNLQSILNFNMKSIRLVI